MSSCSVTGGLPEPRVGRGSALPWRERGCLSGPWLPAPLCSPQMHMLVTQHPCISSRLLCYIRSYLFPTRQSGHFFLRGACIISQQHLYFRFHPKHSPCPSHQCALYPIPGALACSGSGELCWGDFTLWCKDACRGRAWPTSLPRLISWFC